MSCDNKACDCNESSEFSEDEVTIIKMLRASGGQKVCANVARIRRAAKQYGRLDVETDKRNFVSEALEELIDARFYLAAAILKDLDSKIIPEDLAGVVDMVNDAVKILLTLKKEQAS